MSDTKFFNFHAMSSSELERLRTARWRSRHDLQFLCQKVLNYKDVNKEVHGALIDHLQKFPVPNKEQYILNDDFRTGYIKYKPILRLEDFVKQEKVKRRLILDFRGSLKTTINATAHTIQWILNYPNIGILIVQSSIEKAEEILAGVKWHFQYNEAFRAIFPEHVPQKKVHDWCTKGAMKTEAFDGNNLDLGMPHREGTIITGGIDKGMAGKHLDILKFSDIVDPTNTKTEASCFETIKQYELAENLLTSPIYWIDMEGTRYSFADLYGKTIKDTLKEPEDMRVWSIYVRGCYRKQTKDGKPEKFIPEELFLPDLVDKSAITRQNPLGKVSWWPDRYPVEILEYRRKTQPFTFATQMYNSPKSAEEGMIPFPPEKMTWMTRQDFLFNTPKAYIEVSIDTAETDHQKSNHSSICVGCWTGAGNCVVIDIIHGKFLPDKLIENIYKTYIKYKPRTIKIEETSFTRGLISGIRREGEKLGIFLPVEMIKRDNQLAKKERILNTLQPYYFSGQLRFLDDLDKKEELIEELSEFPTGSKDDIIDSICDLFQGKEYFGKELVSDSNDLELERKARELKMMAEYNQVLPILTKQFLQISDFDTINSPSISDSYSRTGGL